MNPRSRRRESALILLPRKQISAPTHVGGYGSRVQCAKFSFGELSPQRWERESPLPEERDRAPALEISPVARPHGQAPNLNPNHNLARLRFLEIKSKITIKSRQKPFRLNSTAVGQGEGRPNHPTEGVRLTPQPTAHAVGYLLSVLRSYLPPLSRTASRFQSL